MNLVAQIFKENTCSQKRKMCTFASLDYGQHRAVEVTCEDKNQDS